MPNPLLADLAARLGQGADPPLPTDARERLRRRLYHAADEMFRIAKGSGNVDLLARAMTAGKVALDVLPAETAERQAGGVVVEVVEAGAEDPSAAERAADEGAPGTRSG